MKQRCDNPNHQAFARYGGRGITYCDDWKDFSPFCEWALTNGYAEGLSIDRIDPNGNYEPANCRWITIHEQQRNKERTIYVEINGVVRTLVEWSELSGVLYRTLRYRYERGIRGEALIDKGHKRKESAIKVAIDGETHTLREWAKLTGIQYRTILYRYGNGTRGKHLIRKPQKSVR